MKCRKMWGKRIRAMVAAAAVVVACGGCATIVSGPGSALPVVTTPEGADCTVTHAVSGVVVASGKTPYIAVLPNSRGYFDPASYRITLRREGYLSREVTVNASLNGWYLVNGVFGNLFGLLYTDPVSGAMWSLPVERVETTLYPDTPAGRRAMAADLPEKKKARLARIKKLLREGKISEASYRYHAARIVRE